MATDVLLQRRGGHRHTLQRTASISLSQNTPECIFLAKKHTITDKEWTNNAKLPKTKHRQLIEQQLKNAIISKIYQIFPDDISSMMIQSATTKVQNLSNTKVINFINNDDKFTEWYDAKHIDSWINITPTTPKNLIDEDDNTLPHVQNELSDDDICDDFRSHQACRTADIKGPLDFSGGKLLTHNEDEDHQLPHAQDVSNNDDKDDHTQLSHAQDVLHYEDDNNFPALGNNVGYKHIVDGNWFNKLLFTLTNNDDEISVQEAHQCNGENQKLP